MCLSWPCLIGVCLFHSIKKAQSSIDLILSYMYLYLYTTCSVIYLFIIFYDYYLSFLIESKL